ncbi:MAG TPA: hypothetical protein VL098_09530 [Flavipsychrobacter sp.]|nr:hypothetical protein [Flavipsychrobacter sp.]
MTFKRFKEITELVFISPIFNKINELELNEYNRALENEKFRDWRLKYLIKMADINVGKHCCLEMKYHLIEYHKEKQELKNNSEYINYDSVIVYDKSQKYYGIPIHDGGSSYIKIKHCPWCGTQIG